MASYRDKDGYHVELHKASDGWHAYWWVERIPAFETRATFVGYADARRHYRIAVERGQTYCSLPGQGGHAALGKDGRELPR